MTALPPTTAEWLHATQLHDLERAVLGVLAGASPSISLPERAAVLAEALTGVALDSAAWCPRCRADREAGICMDHMGGVELANAMRRYAYLQLPGRPGIDVDL